MLFLRNLEFFFYYIYIYIYILPHLKWWCPIVQPTPTQSSIPAKVHQTHLHYNIIDIISDRHRAYHLSPNYSLFNDEIYYLKTFFENNGYPLKFFDSILRKFLNKVRRPIIPTITVEKRTVYVSLPCFGPHTHDLGKQLNAALSPCYPQINFKFCFKNNYQISSFFKFKDSLPACWVVRKYYI